MKTKCDTIQMLLLLHKLPDTNTNSFIHPFTLLSLLNTISLTINSVMLIKCICSKVFLCILHRKLNKKFVKRIYFIRFDNSRNF